ncbi:hypothetical protein [Paenibacillus sp. CMAA1364]
MSNREERIQELERRVQLLENNSKGSTSMLKIVLSVILGIVIFLMSVGIIQFIAT